MGQQQCARSYPSGRRGGFAPGVAAAYNDDIEPITHPPLSAIETGFQPCLNAKRLSS
jgi:hypothetical protein